MEELERVVQWLAQAAARHLLAHDGYWALFVLAAVAALALREILRGFATRKHRPTYKEVRADSELGAQDPATPSSPVSYRSQYVFTLLCILGLCLAVFADWPYVFYVLLRLVVCVTSIYWASEAYKRNWELWMWLFLANALMFNPVLPIRMARSDWQIADCIGAFFLGVWLVSKPFTAPVAVSIKPRRGGRS